MENQTRRKIQELGSDNEGEYTSKEFDGYCRQEGIRRQLTVPYTPEQNGVAERKNKSIVEASRAMLHDQSLPFFLWAEACSTTVYLQNRSPHCAMGNKTPKESFTGKKPFKGSKSSNLLWRTKQGGGFKCCVQILRVGIPPLILMSFINRRGSRDS